MALYRPMGCEVRSWWVGSNRGGGAEGGGSEWFQILEQS